MSDRKSRATESDELIVVAQIVKTRGLRGELVAELLTDFPDRFEAVETINALAPDKSRRSLQIEEHWFHGRRIVFKFAGYDSIETAKELVGFQLVVPESDRVELAQDQFYEWELIGCRVETLAGETIGTVRELMRTGGVEILVVADESGRDHLIPMAEEICVEIDTGHKVIRVNPPEGLLEL